MDISGRKRETELLRPSHLDEMEGDEWRREAFGEFTGKLKSQEAGFPCIYAVHALRHDNLRLTFIESANDRGSLKVLAQMLEHYVRDCRSLTPYTAFVAFFREPDIDSLVGQKNHFWAVLQFLHEFDGEPWPAEVPMEPDDPGWEFCFGGEPMFALAAGPVHHRRRSRHSRRFMVSFQPRFQFDELAKSPDLLERGRTIIRKRVLAMDGFPIHPANKMFGDPGNLEWKQYVMPESNAPVHGACPFRPRAQA